MHQYAQRCLCRREQNDSGGKKENGKRTGDGTHLLVLPNLGERDRGHVNGDVGARGEVAEQA